MAVLYVFFFIITNYFLKIHASYHWVVTENGRIQSQIKNSGFPLRQPDDLILFLEQEERISAIAQMYKELIFFKASIDSQWAKIEGEGDLKKRLYSSDIDCILGSKPLTQHDLSTEFVDYGDGPRPKSVLNVPSFEPDCTTYSKLDFSMMTFPHLETLNNRENLTISPLPAKTDIQFDIDSMLKKNQTDWTAYNVASFYWRIMGNGTNALECARRAIYFSPRDKRHIVLLNLGTLLQELESLGEAAIVLHSAVDHDPLQPISHLALGNVYAALGDHKRSLACYENVLSLYPEHERALQLKHAIFCHNKLESGLLKIHASLQNIVQDLQKCREMKEKWLLLQNQVNWDRDNKLKDIYTYSEPDYLNLCMLLSNVEQQAKSIIQDVSKTVDSNKRERLDMNQKRSTSDCSIDGASNTDTIAGERKSELEWSEEVEDDGGDAKSMDNAGYLLCKKVNYLKDFIKSMNYDSEVSITEFKRKIHQQINFLRNPNGESHFSADQATFLTDFGGCLNNYDKFKNLNECFTRVLNLYSINVRNRITKLKEKIELINQATVGKLPLKDVSVKNTLPDESSLENYLYGNPEILFEADSCQRLRDTTEL